MNPSSLFLQFRQLLESRLRTRDKARTGLALERLLSDLFRQQGILSTKPFAISGEQIDGAFEHKGWTYLVEVKWQDKKQSTDALYAFQGKSDRRIEGTRGLFISMSGYHRTSINRFAQGRKPNTILWTSEHIEAVLEGRITIQELLDLSIRYAAERSELIFPIERALADYTNGLFTIALNASSAQVDAEISATVGRKFIPKLYVERGVQEDLSKLIHPERDVENLLAELAKAGIIPPKRVVVHKQDKTHTLAIFRSLMESARNRKGSYQAHGSLRLFLDVMPLNPMGRMHVITSRAGMGKTNLLCHLAKLYAKQQPTVFLTGRSGITSTTSLKDLIESKLAAHLPKAFPQSECFDQIVSLARVKNTSLLVIIDALNEHKDFDQVSSSISHFLNQAVDMPVVVLASCRDVYWPFFDTSFWPTEQWKLFERRLDLFSKSESERAIEAYFDFYHLNARLTDSAKQKLSHPLILRFFCEAYGDPTSPDLIELPEIPDIRLKVLFDEYLKRKLDSICHTSPKRFRTPDSVRDFLFCLADQMRRTKSRDVQRDDVPTVTKHQDLDSPESTYVSILGEDILLEEEPAEQTGQIRVVFTYDEFMEYMIASSMLRSSGSAADIDLEQLFEECQNGAEAFPSLVGVAEYLAVILREDWQRPAWHLIRTADIKFGNAVCRAIGKLGPEFVGVPEISKLEDLLKANFEEVRVLSVQRLGAIASSKEYKQSSRMKASELLVTVLRREDNVAMRTEAIECFADGSASNLCPSGQRVADWWKRRSLAVRELPIMFSDDEPSLREVFNLVFPEWGWKNFYVIEDPLTTIDLAERTKPALIITDMLKPGMSGAEMAARIRANPETCAIPMLLLSGIAGDRNDYPDLFCAALKKPESSEKLLRTIEVILIGKYDE